MLLVYTGQTTEPVSQRRVSGVEVAGRTEPKGSFYCLFLKDEPLSYSVGVDRVESEVIPSAEYIFFFGECRLAHERTSARDSVKFERSDSAVVKNNFAHSAAAPPISDLLMAYIARCSRG